MIGKWTTDLMGKDPTLRPGTKEVEGTPRWSHWPLGPQVKPVGVISFKVEAEVFLFFKHLVFNLNPEAQVIDLKRRTFKHPKTQI